MTSIYQMTLEQVRAECERQSKRANDVEAELESVKERLSGELLAGNYARKIADIQAKQLKFIRDTLSEPYSDVIIMERRVEMILKELDK